MKVAVTGACGFVGSHVCDELRSRGHSVLGLDDLSTAWLDAYGKSRWPVPTPTWRIEEAEAIVHLGCRYPVEREISTWATAHVGFVGGFVSLVAALVQHHNLKRIVVGGTLEVMNVCDRDPFAGAACSLWHALSYLHRPPQLSVVFADLPEIYGPRATVACSLLPAFLGQVAQSDYVPRYKYVAHVCDVAAFLVDQVEARSRLSMRCTVMGDYVGDGKSGTFDAPFYADLSRGEDLLRSVHETKLWYEEDSRRAW